jgi:hypothetical protein
MRCITSILALGISLSLHRQAIFAAFELLSDVPVLQPGQMAGANPAVRPIVWTSGIIQFCPYLNG